MTPDAHRLVSSATDWAPVPFVPEVTLRTAAEPFGLWDRTARDAPPFWAFPWAGGQGLARYVLDHPDTVAGRNVLDVASGSGLVAIAAAKAGAKSVHWHGAAPDAFLSHTAVSLGLTTWHEEVDDGHYRKAFGGQ